jgi:hypothetical protein
VINPTYRTLDGQVRKKVALLNRKIAEFGAINLDDDIEPEKVEAFAQRKSDLHQVIAQLRQEVDELKVQRRATKRHITYNERALRSPKHAKQASHRYDQNDRLSGRDCHGPDRSREDDAPR